MPLGIVSDDEFQSELENSEVRGGRLPEILPMERPGRNKGDNNVPEGLRKIIGETSELEGRSDAVELAKMFGLSPSSVSAYANGSTSTSSYKARPNIDHIIKAKERIGKKARNKLVKALDSITDDKLEGAKATDLSSIARNMSAIVKDMEPEDINNPQKDKPQFVFFAPQVRDERHYEVTIARE